MKAYEEENWKPVVGYEGFYEVSDLGRVRNIKNRKNTFVGRIRKPGFDKDGYHQMVLSKPGKRYSTRIHRLVLSNFIGPCPKGLQINHIDGNKGNNRLDNIEYVTPSENRLHAYAIGLQSQRGENNAGSKLTEEDVHKVRARLSAGESQTGIAASLNVSIGAIHGIALNKTWSWLEEPKTQKDITCVL